MIADLHCKCGQFLCQRRGDSVRANASMDTWLKLRRTQAVLCQNCGYTTYVKVDRKSVDNKPKGVKLEVI